MNDILFSNGTMLSVSDKSELVNERTHADQQQIKFYILGVRRELLPGPASKGDLVVPCTRLQFGEPSSEPPFRGSLQ